MGHIRAKKQISAAWFLRGENRLLGCENELLEIVSRIESFSLNQSVLLTIQL